MKDEEIYRAAIEEWGVHLQLIMVLEEMSELAKEITHLMRGNGSPVKLIDERADVGIMLEQLDIILTGYDENYKNRLSTARMNKLVRLKQRVTEHQQNRQVKP